MNRRGFLGSILAAAVAPAIVRADSLMRIVPRETLVVWGPNSIEMDMPNPWVRLTASGVLARQREMDRLLLQHAERVCNPAVIYDMATDRIVAILSHTEGALREMRMLP